MLYRILVLGGILVVMTSMVGCSSANETATQAGSHGRGQGLTVIPPGPVTDKIEVEIRLTVRNDKTDAQTYAVSFYWDEASHQHLIDSQRVRVSGGEAVLVNAWAPTAEHEGKHDLLFRVQCEGTTVAEGSWPLEVSPCETRALPLIQGVWYDPGMITFGGYGPQGATEDDIRGSVDAIKRLGANILIISYVESSSLSSENSEGLVYYPSSIERDFLKPAGLDFDPIEAILLQADDNDMHVFIGNGRGGDLYLLWNGFGDVERTQRAIDLGVEMANELWDRYGHHPSFYGWYFAHEADDIAQASAYYNPLADHCHSLAPDKPVMVAPAGAPTISPDILRDSHVDIFAYQDSVGYGYKDLKATWDPEVRIADLPEIYRHYREMHEGTGKHLWSDLEIWRGSGDPKIGSRPAKIDEVKRQIAIEAKYVETITAYTYQFIGGKASATEPLEPAGGYATKLYNDLLDYQTQTLGKAYTGH